MTINDIAQIIIAGCVVTNAVQSLLIFFHSKKAVEEIKTVKTEVVAVAKATNGLQEKLLAVTGELKFAEGKAEGVKSVAESVKSAEDTAALKQISR